MGLDISNNLRGPICTPIGGTAVTLTWPSIPHYSESRTIEPIAVIEDWKLGFHLGNVIKYIARLGRDGEDELVTLKKAQSYLDREIHRRICSPSS